jgi:small-conductance mechanosensitive channel
MIYFVAIIWALSELGLSTLVLSIILAAVIVMIIVAILLGIKDFVPNAFAGFAIYKKGVMQEGDYIKINSLSGRIKKITLTETEVETKRKELIIVPNMNFRKQAVLIRKH